MEALHSLREAGFESEPEVVRQGQVQTRRQGLELPRELFNPLTLGRQRFRLLVDEVPFQVEPGEETLGPDAELERTGTVAILRIVGEPITAGPRALCATRLRAVAGTLPVPLTGSGGLRGDLVETG